MSNNILKSELEREIQNSKDAFNATTKIGGNAKLLSLFLHKQGVKKFSPSTLTNILSGQVDNIPKLQQFQYWCQSEEYTLFLTSKAFQDVHKNDKPSKLASFFNKAFYLYYIDTRRDTRQNFIGRSILLIGASDKDVEILGTEPAFTYRGTMKISPNNPNHIVFELKTKESNSKDLKMIFRIPTELTITQNHDFMLVGSYMNIAEYDSVVTGSIIIEQCIDNEEKKPLVLIPSTPEYENLNDNVKKFFLRKERNYAKSPFIDNDKKQSFAENFVEFFAKQKAKRNREAIQNTFGKGALFVSYPMLSLSKEKFEVLTETIQKIIVHLENVLNYVVHHSIPDKTTDFSIVSPDAVEDGLEKLYACDRFLLVYPEETDIHSSCLIELGWALAERKMCVVYYQKSVKLPYILQHLPRIKKLSYIDNEHLLKQIEGMGSYLFQ